MCMPAVRTCTLLVLITMVTLTPRAQGQEPYGALREYLLNWNRTTSHPLTPEQYAWFISSGSTHPNMVAEAPADPLCIRKEVRTMGTSAWKQFGSAVNMLKNWKVDGLSSYDIFVTVYNYEVSPGSQGGANFLPWHREFLLR